MKDVTRVLVVDDDPGFVSIASTVLRKAGYEVHTAADGLQGLDRLKADGPYQVLLVDLMMPEMNGWELARHAKRFDPETQVILITACGTLESAIEALGSRLVFDYLLKPLETVRQLVTSVERAVEHRRLRLERAALHIHIEQEAARLRAIIQNTGDAILAADAAGNLTDANPAARRLLAAVRLGEPIQATLPPRLMHLVTNWQEISGHTPVSLEMTWQDNSIQHISLTPLSYNGGTYGGWVMVMRDITHLKQFDDARTRALMEAATRVRRPLADVMNSLVNLNQLAAQDQRAADTLYRLTRVWGDIQEWSERLVDLVYLNNNGSGKRLINIHLADLFSYLKTELKDRPDLNGLITLQVELAPDLPQIKVDAAKLQTLLKSLVDRAVLRSQPGDTVYLRAYTFQDQVWIEVQDDGTPMSEYDLLHIFDKSLLGNTDTASLRVGVGLAAARQILNHMDGQIWISRREPLGGTILVCLPVAEA